MRNVHEMDLNDEVGKDTQDVHESVKIIFRFVFLRYIHAWLEVKYLTWISIKASTRRTEKKTRQGNKWKSNLENLNDP